jgi:HD-GYP domain-containing protein (c-di-GMP phosphodiesterase class II)
MIHDLGKIGIPSEILMRSGPLVPLEYDLIKTHPKKGYDILKNIPFPFPLAEIVYQHHERVNGSGYPRGLMAADMLTEAKILAVAEVVEAMSATRPYRPAWDTDITLLHIEENRGILFDPAVVDACVRLIREKGYRIREEKE